MIERKINVILDLDSTLLCSVPLNVIASNLEVFKELNENEKAVNCYKKLIKINLPIFSPNKKPEIFPRANYR